MGLIKEPLEVDFVVESRPLTAGEILQINEFIQADKAKYVDNILSINQAGINQ